MERFQQEPKALIILIRLFYLPLLYYILTHLDLLMQPQVGTGMQDLEDIGMALDLKVLYLLKIM
jgi:hypothetical protein